MYIPKNATQTAPKSHITKDEFYKLCNISKKTAHKLLESGKIISEKCYIGQRHYYKIPISEIEKYLHERKNKGVLTRSEKLKMKSYYTENLNDYAEVMTSPEISHITGYCKETIRDWINSRKILGAVSKGQFKVAKDDLVDFLLSPYYQNIQRKSDIHKASEALNLGKRSIE